MRNHLRSRELFWTDSHYLPCNRLSAAEYLLWNCSRCDGFVGIVDVSDVRGIRDIRYVCYVSNIGDIDDIQILPTVVIPGEERFSRP